MRRYLKCSIIGFTIAVAIANPSAAAHPDVKPTEEQIVRLLYSKEEIASNGGKHLVYRAWPQFAGRYIVASYGEPEGNTGQTLAVEVAVVQYSATAARVISRGTFRYAVGFDVDRVEIDTANYRIADAVTAFGLRTYSRYASSRYEHQYEALDLYTVGSNGISHIWGNLAFGDNGLAGSHDEYFYCAAHRNCGQAWSREVVKTILIVAQNKTNEYFDLIVKTTKTEQVGRFDRTDKSPRHRKKPETTRRIFKWDGERYEEE